MATETSEVTTCDCCEFEDVETTAMTLLERDYQDGREASLEKRICSDCLARARRNEYLLLPVRDNGPGLAPVEWWLN